MRFKALTTITAVIFSLAVSAQDLVYTVTGQVEDTSVKMDSILIENINNGSRLLFDNLPNQDSYRIELSTGEILNMADRNLAIEDRLKITKNIPGELEINVLSNKLKEIHATVINMQGQVLWMNNNLSVNPNSTINFSLPGNGLYVIRVNTNLGQKTYMAIGSPTNNGIDVSISGGSEAQEARLKNAYIHGSSDFDFQYGDSLRVSAFLDNYYSRPRVRVISSSETINFKFEPSQVETNGTSDVYTNVHDSTFTSVEYSDATGIVTIIPGDDDGVLVTGDIITVDLDTAGYLRKVIGVTEENGKVILETEQATMNELFVDKAFKLNTTLIEPSSTLKSTSSMMDISRALTDEQGYIHPLKVILFDENGGAYTKTVTGKKGVLDEIRQPIVSASMDFSLTDLYGKQGDNTHFYISEGLVTFNTDAVFEFDFTYEGEFTEDTKVKKGDLNVFEFYLEATAGLQTKIGLDMSKAWDKADDPKHLFKIAKARAQFAVPPGVPVWIDFDVNMYRAMILHADASLQADWGFEIADTLKLGGRYTRETKEMTPISVYKHHDVIYPLNLQGEINASARLELFPRVDIKLYSIFGPYAEVVPYVQGNYKAAMQSQITPENSETFLAFNAGLDLGLDLRVGTELKVLGFKRGFGPIEINCLNYPLWYAPGFIQLITELPEQIQSGSTLELNFVVTDNLGLPSNLAPVYLEGNGSFNKYLGFTDPFGNISVDWTIGEAEGVNNIIASVFNADKTVADFISESVVGVNQNPPIATFTATPTSITEGESIQFTDQSTNAPTEWEWDFGDGSTSSDQNPSHTYSSAGNYSVSLQVTNSYGSDSETKTDYIAVTGNGGGETGTFTDSRDGKTYSTIQIGTQTWMAENLAYLPSVVGPATESYTDPYHYVYGYNGTSVSDAKATTRYQTYGVLYNWPAAMQACPAGWHLPSDAEWKTLEMHLGMSQGEADATGWRGTDEGGKLKEVGATHWISPNTGATNESGFLALPGGYRGGDGSFYGAGYSGYWWSATESSSSTAWYRTLNYASGDVSRYYSSKEYGFSVRCLRDN